VWGEKPVDLMWLKIVLLVETGRTQDAENEFQTVILKGIVTNSEIQ
jgi:hypothetical protein